MSASEIANAPKNISTLLNSQTYLFFAAFCDDEFFKFEESELVLYLDLGGVGDLYLYYRRVGAECHLGGDA